MSATGYFELPPGQGNWKEGFEHEGGNYYATSYSSTRFPTREAAEAFMKRVGFVDRNGYAVQPEFKTWDR